MTSLHVPDGWLVLCGGMSIWWLPCFVGLTTGPLWPAYECWICQACAGPVTMWVPRASMHAACVTRPSIFVHCALAHACLTALVPTMLCSMVPCSTPASLHACWYEACLVLITAAWPQARCSLTMCVSSQADSCIQSTVPCALGSCLKCSTYD